MAILSLIAKLGLDGSGFQRGIQQAEKSTDSLSKKLGGAFAATAVTAAITAVSKKTIDYAGQLDDLSQRTGVGTEQLQEFGYAAGQSGSSLETFGSFLEKVNVSRLAALEGNEEMTASFAKLGVSVADLKSMPVEELAKKIGNVVKDGNVSELIKDLREVGGKSAGELVGAFKSGLDEMAQEARNSGAVIDAELVSKLDEIGDKFSTIGKQILAFVAPIVGGIADLFQAILDQAGRVMAFFGGLTGGGMKGASQALANFDKGIVDREQRTIDTRKAKSEASKGDFSKVENKTEKDRAEKAEKDAEREKEKAAKEIESLEKQKGKGPTTKVDTDSLAKIGGLVGGAASFDPSLFVAKDQLRHLKSIDAKIREIANRSTVASVDPFV